MFFDPPSRAVVFVGVDIGLFGLDDLIGDEVRLVGSDRKSKRKAPGCIVRQPNLEIELVKLRISACLC